ncbi:MotA/TolQ/ExbB proton channel family protein [Kiritimatiellota bacterium B12222]|nr:MotA/TolQ/ExbB proton channel family protein [Kiritimatiellota bacterium B12222]
MRSKAGQKEFQFQLMALAVIVILVHASYAWLIRPKAVAWAATQSELSLEEKTMGETAPLVIILKDYEQEACMILFLWALSLMGYKAIQLKSHTALLDQDFVQIEDGRRILPEDARELTRRLQSLPSAEQRALMPRALLAALHRFESTRNIQDVSETVTQLCMAEGERQESELSMVRYIAWAIPSIGFIGTVRGIGMALSQAQSAVEGDIGPVTDNLGTAFNSTLIALVLSIFLMFAVHQLQLQQERYVLDVQDEVESKLINLLHVTREVRA